MSEAPKPETSTTPAQRAAIEAGPVSVCVAAGAGSGKTFVLVERFLELVRRGADPTEVLTITFTEKAAREMRERIAKALEKRGLERERAALEGGWISTIHGFCARLLRTYAVEADVDPAFGVLTDLPKARVRRAAFKDAYDGFRRDHPDAFHALVDRVRWGRDEDGFAGIDQRVHSLHEGLRAAGARPRGAPAGTTWQFDALDAPAVVAALVLVREAARAWREAVGAAARVTAHARDKLAQGLARIGALEPAFAVGSPGTGRFSTAVHRAIVDATKAVRGAGQFKDEREALVAALTALAGAYVQGPARTLGAALEDLVARFDAAYTARKARLAVLDFGDLEERARELLETRPDVAADVRARFKAVLVDEFQDTSRLQQRIVDLVRAPGSFFAVGDVKQAIYGFRHAEVRGLLEVEDEVRRSGGLVVPLDVSFRTRPSVLAYVDAVFAPLFGAPGSEVPHQPLRSADSVAFAEKAEASVEAILAHGESLEAGRASEARAIAARLASIVEEKRLKGTNPLRQDSFDKPLRYRDCAILFRAMTELGTYERALRERGVPYRVDRGGGFFEAAEVVDALALLRVIASSRDDLALAAVLRSPVVGLSDDALLALARIARETPAPGAAAPPVRDGWLARALVRVAQDPDAGRLSADERERARGFVATLSDLRARRGGTSARDLLEDALARTGLAEASLVRSGSARGVANLKKLLAIVAELEAEPSLGLDDVVFALEDLRSSASREGEASLAGGDEDAVQLMTVHAAKGLEWPLVVVADLGRSDNPFSDPIAWSPGTGPVPVVADPESPGHRLEPPDYARLVRAKKEREREESKRLLYVAMTRARDHLILAGARGGSRDAGPWLAWSLGPLDVGAAALSVEPDLALGAPARTIPGPDPTGVRLVQLAPGRAPLAGPLGPDSGAQTLLDPAARERIAQGLPPAFAASAGTDPSIAPGEEDRAEARAALARAERPLPEPDLGASVYAVTEVLAYEQCPRLYLYEHVLGARPGAAEAGLARGIGAEDDVRASVDESEDAPVALPRTDDPFAVPRSLLGTIAHRALELGPERTPARVRELVAAEAGAILSASGTAAASRLILEWAARFDRSPLGQRVARASAVLREKPFLVRVPLPGGGDDAALLLRGTADLVFVEEATGAVLVDYKTNDLMPLEVPAKARAYALQLQLYALALADFAGAPLREAWLSFLAADQSVSVDVSPPALVEARARLARFAEARRQGRFEPRPQPLCRTCDFRAACPAGREPTPAPGPRPELVAPSGSSS